MFSIIDNKNRQVAVLFSPIRFSRSTSSVLIILEFHTFIGPRMKVTLSSLLLRVNTALTCRTTLPTFGKIFDQINL
jgi:hypothetical protein